MDVLADLLDRARARGAAFALTTVHGADWGLRFEPARLAIHVVLAGEAVLTSSSGSTTLRAGDVAGVRSSGTHSLRGRPGAALVDLSRFLQKPGVRRSDQTYVADGDGAPTTFVCGAYRFDGDLCSALLDGLPEVIVVPATRGTTVCTVVDLLAAEFGGAAPGRQTLLDRLLDVLLISVLRAHFAAAPSSAPTWYAALHDPVVGAALRAIHEDPAAPTTVASLARVAQVSRATLAQRFTQLVGVPPSTYLTSWRLQLAKERLRESEDTLHVIAREVGYGSGYAFATAFKRETGDAPGVWRAAAGRVTPTADRQSEPEPWVVS